MSNPGRAVFDAGHAAFRESFRKFVEREIVPNHHRWEEAGSVSRELWGKAGGSGFLGLSVPERYGGAGVEDFRYEAVIIEELRAAGATGAAFPLHSAIVAPYISRYGSDAQRDEWLPKMCAGTAIGAIAMTEPDAGSDLAGVQTRAVADGSDFVINGQKTYISNGMLADLIITVVRTGPERHKGLTLLIVPGDADRLERRRLRKIGLHAQDTAELFFDGVRVPGTNVLGTVGGGFTYLMANLAIERLVIAVGAVTSARTAVDLTAGFCKERRMFGSTLSRFQNTRFTLAGLHAEVQVGQAFVDDCLRSAAQGTLTPDQAAIAKLWCGEMAHRVATGCLQFFGGAGYMNETDVARIFLDTRVDPIHGGASEVMKEIIARSLGL